MSSVIESVDFSTCDMEVEIDVMESVVSCASFRSSFAVGKSKYGTMCLVNQRYLYECSVAGVCQSSDTDDAKRRISPADRSAGLYGVVTLGHSRRSSRLAAHGSLDFLWCEALGLEERNALGERGFLDCGVGEELDC